MGLLIRRAARGLRRSPGFTALCVLTLAVGIGADTAVFSLFDSVLLRPLPYPNAERLLFVGTTVPGLELPEVGVSDGVYALYRDRQHTLADLALARTTAVNLAGTESPRRVPAATATASLFPVLGIAPRLGRNFTREDEKLGGPAVVVLGDRLWHELGADPGIVGQALKIDGVPTQVVGVMPKGFAFPDLDTALWLPRRLDVERQSLAYLNDDMIALLPPGGTPQAVAVELTNLVHGLDHVYAAKAAKILVNGGIAPIVKTLRDHQVGDLRTVLWLLLGAVGCILAIACANVANLLIVRGEGRQRELAIHAALGAPRAVLLGGVLAESLLIGAAAGVVGIAIAWGGLHLLAALRPPALAQLAPVSLDGRALAFAAVLIVLTSLLSGLVPAWRAIQRGELGVQLKTGGRAVTAGRRQQRVRQGLVGLQMALAVVLLTGAGLMLESFRHLSRIDPGFDPRNVLTLDLSLPEAEYPDDVSVAHALDAVLQRVQALPGVVTAGATSTLPLANASVAGHDFEDFPRVADELPPLFNYQYVAGDYFRAMGIPLLSGRYLETRDAEGRTGAVLVSEAVARHYWPQGSPLGRHLRLQRGAKPGDPWYTIVGVVGNIRQRDLTDTEPVKESSYPVLAMRPGAWVARQMALAIRTRVAPASLASAVRDTLRGVAPDVPLANLRTMEEILHESRSRIEFSALMVLLATAVALALGAVGLYGFVSYLVGLRTSEIGIRMAMGADGRRIRWLILREALVTTAFGLGVGLLAAAAASRFLATLLYQVSPLDPLAFAVAPLVLVVAMLAASYIPAVRASRIEPKIALERSE